MSTDETEIELLSCQLYWNLYRWRIIRRCLSNDMAADFSVVGFTGYWYIAAQVGQSARRFSIWCFSTSLMHCTASK